MGSFTDWLVVDPTLEQELLVEANTREIMQCEDNDELSYMAASLWKSNYYKDQIIKNCIGKIGETEARLIQYEMKEEREQARPWWLNFLRKESLSRSCED